MHLLRHLADTMAYDIRSLQLYLRSNTREGYIIIPITGSRMSALLANLQECIAAKRCLVASKFSKYQELAMLCAYHISDALYEPEKVGSSTGNERINRYSESNDIIGVRRQVQTAP
jgi:hypothetical protein